MSLLPRLSVLQKWPYFFLIDQEMLIILFYIANWLYYKAYNSIYINMVMMRGKDTDFSVSFTNEMFPE